MTLQNNLLQADAENRLKALELRSFIVEAPAGAGKTELLTQRFLKLLPTVKQPEEIIAITFTNKAAAEMRLRILDSLIAAAKQEKPSESHKQITYELSLQALQHAAAHDWQLIENPSRLRIFTIDSLCAHLARQMPLMSRFGAQPRVTDNADALYTQAAEQTLALLEHKDYGEVLKIALRYVDNDAAQLTNLLVTMLAKRDQWLSHAQGELAPEQLQNTLAYLVAQALQAAEHALPIAIQHLLMPVARFAAANLLAENIGQNQPLMDWQTPLEAAPEDLLMWRALADLLLTNTGEVRKEKGLNVKFGFPPTDEGKAQKLALVEIIAAIDDTAALHRVRQLPNVSDDASSWQIIATLSQLLNIAVAQLWLTFQRAGEVDFVEIAQRATRALSDNFGEPTELALKLDYQIQHLLVDEFQDTSPSQVELLKQLTLGWQANDARTLFCVGDPMQSIYRFRKANVGLFISAATDGIGDIQLKKLQLYRNNRSCPALVDWINATFASIFPAHDDDAQGAIGYRPFIATKPAENDAGVEVCAIIKCADESTESASQREADAIVRIIQREQTANPNKKIAVLVRSKKHLAALVTKLRREHTDIAFQAVEIEALHGRQIVQDLLALTHALHNRADRVHWLSILRAPWCGLTLEDLHKLAGANHHATIWSLMQNDELVNQLEGKQRLQHVRDIFAEAFATQGRMATSKWIRGIWLMLNGTACLWEQADIVDVQAFFACLDALDRSNQFSPERMTTEITKLFASPDSHGENLQMMSIHKSKGLEFDCVILPGLGASTGGNNRDKPLVLWEEVTIGEHTELLAAPYIPKGWRDIPKGFRDDTVSAYDYIETLENERDANEAARVLYVAATRAERKLHLVGVANQNAKAEIKPIKNSYLDLLWDAVSHEFEAAELSAKSVDENANADDIANFTSNLIRLKQLQIPSILQTEKTPTNQANKPQTNQNPQQIVLNLAADAGILAHRYMEMIANDGLEHWPASRIDASAAAMRFWLMQRGHAKNESEKLTLEQAVSQIVAALKKTIASPQGAWILASRPSRQAELSITTIDENAEVQEQRIDLTFIENNELGEKVRWIIDYKLTAANENLEIAVQQHKPQLARYAALFAHEDLPIKTAVFFLNLDQLVEV
jgi:ATP-dependent helicase/nuclease subunit A